MDLDPKHFALLRPGPRIWAVAAVRGEAARLRQVHTQITALFQPGDRLVYLGDVIGPGAEIRGTVDEVLRFRRLVLSMPPFSHPDDVIVLREGVTVDRGALRGLIATPGSDYTRELVAGARVLDDALGNPGRSS